MTLPRLNRLLRAAIAAIATVFLALPAAAATASSLDTRSFDDSNPLNLSCELNQQSFYPGQTIEATITGAELAEAEYYRLTLYREVNGEVVGVGSPARIDESPWYAQPAAGATSLNLSTRVLDSAPSESAYNPETGSGWRVECFYQVQGMNYSISVPVEITSNGHESLPAPVIAIDDFTEGTSSVPLVTSNVYSLCAQDNPSSPPGPEFFYPAQYDEMFMQVYDFDSGDAVSDLHEIPLKPEQCRYLPEDSYPLVQLGDLPAGSYYMAVFLRNEGYWESDMAVAEFTVLPANAPSSGYPLWVYSGSGSGTYEPGTKVEITAWELDEYDFDAWKVLEGDAQIADPTSPTTTVTMGTTESEITATYRDVCIDDGTCDFYLVNDWASTEAHSVFHFGDGTGEPFTGDFDGWGDSTVGLRNGNHFLISNYNFTSPPEWDFHFGRSSDTILVGDWDGDGKDTLAIRRGNRVYLTSTLGQTTAEDPFYYGREGDEVLVGDWDGDGKDTLGVRRGNTFYLRNSNDNGVADVTFHYGREGDQVLVGDWNGNGIDTFTVRRGRTYYMANSFADGPADTVLTYGRPTDLVIVGDWDADGWDTLGIYRPH